MFKYILLSFLIHLALFVRFPDKKSDQGPSGAEHESIGDSIRVQLKDGPTSKGDSGTISVSSGKQKDCETYYYGVGYISRIETIEGVSQCFVAGLADGGPADMAGLQIGDQVLPLNGEVCPGRGPENTEIELMIKRGENLMIYAIARKKICTD